ncbi:MAG: hypothetical protein K6A92_06380 [Lachnospiraceae bacterium]|nr:hypothetical protein [Lachnospiraceae bacterium]
MQKNRCFGALYAFELKKILKNKVAIVTFLFFFFYAFLQGEFEVSGNYPPSRLAETEALNGRALDADLLEECLAVVDETGRVTDEETNGRYMDLASLVREVIGYGTDYQHVTIDDFYGRRMEIVEEIYEDSCLTEGEIRYWKEKETQIEKPFIYHDTMVSSGILEGTTNYAIMLLLILSVGLAGCFAQESQRRTDPMIRASINGGKELYFAKVLAGMTYVFGCTVILLGTFFTYLSLKWGLRGIHTMVQNYYPESQMPLTIGQETVILLILLILGMLLMSAFALFVSNVSRNALATMAIVLGVYMGMFALSTAVPISMRWLNQALCLLPSTLISSRMVLEYRLIHLGRYFLCYEIAPILYLLMTAFFIAAGYALYKRHEIRSN